MGRLLMGEIVLLFEFDPAMKSPLWGWEWLYSNGLRPVEALVINGNTIGDCHWSTWIFRKPAFSLFFINTRVGHGPTRSYWSFLKEERILKTPVSIGVSAAFHFELSDHQICPSFATIMRDDNSAMYSLVDSIAPLTFWKALFNMRHSIFICLILISATAIGSALFHDHDVEAATYRFRCVQWIGAGLWHSIDQADSLYGWLVKFGICSASLPLKACFVFDPSNRNWSRLHRQKKALTTESSGAAIEPC